MPPEMNDDLPESDITTIRGVRCTTALRTMIDLALELDRAEFEGMVRQWFDRRLFTPAEAHERAALPDMQNHPGAQLLLTGVDGLRGPG